MSRLPIRVRLTLVFTAVLAALLCGSGTLLYEQEKRSLDRTVDAGLRTRAADVGALVAQADTGLSEAPASDGTAFAQVLYANGRVLDATQALRRRPLLTSAQLAGARRETVLIGRTLLAGRPVRLLARPVYAQNQRLVVVVGAPLRSRDDALATLRGALLVVAPLTLALIALVVYRLAAAALRPVERMRAEAARLSADQLDERLSLPPSRDEVARLGQTLNDLLGRVQQALGRERRFVADASHELRSPLALLRIEVEHALDRPRPAAELEAALRSVADETDRLSQLAEDLLLLARVHEGGLPLRTEPLAVEELLGGVAERFGQRAEGAGRALVVSAAPLTVEGDRLRLAQALGNLVENALRHGGGDVELRAVRTDSAVELHVGDEGAGFPGDFLADAFARFTQAEASRGGPGAGLGLAIVAVVAHAHGGKAEARNRSPRGADVWMTIPLAAAGANRPPPSVHGPSMSAS